MCFTLEDLHIFHILSFTSIFKRNWRESQPRMEPISDKKYAHSFSELFCFLGHWRCQSGHCKKKTAIIF